jgi:hypothetical protein
MTEKGIRSSAKTALPTELSWLSPTTSIWLVGSIESRKASSSVSENGEQMMQFQAHKQSKMFFTLFTRQCLRPGMTQSTSSQY